jgi:outer membrane immunogenic protein
MMALGSSIGETMKKLLVAGALASMAMAAPAVAAEIPLKALPPVAAPALYNWSGLYIGIEGGAIAGQNSDWRFLNVNTTEIFAPPRIQPLPTGLCFPLPGQLVPLGSAPGDCANVGHPMHGGFVGGEIGFNWQAPGSRWVVGIEADGNWAQLEEALTCAQHFAVDFGGFDVCGSKIRDFETVRARIGYAWGPRGDFLTFVTGGWATASQSAFETTLFPVVVSGLATFPRAEQWRRVNGFTVGGGFEYGITSWLTLKAEALYVWLEGKDYCAMTGAGPLFTGTLPGGCTNVTAVVVAPGPNVFLVAPAHVHDDFVLFRMGLNAKFWWGKTPTPVVAKY